MTISKLAMNLAHFSILGAVLALCGGCSTYETKTTISLGETPEQYAFESEIVLKKGFHKSSKALISRSSGRFHVDRGAWSRAGVIWPDGSEKVSFIRIFPSREIDPRAVEVRYYKDKEPGIPALDRREWVELPGH